MNLEFKNIDEANSLINQLIENHPHAVFISDKEYKIQYFNQSFLKLCQRKKNDIIGKLFCEVIGCRECKNAGSLEEMKKRCQMTDLLYGSNVSEFDVIRDFDIDNKVVTKRLHINTHRIEMNEEKYRLVVIDDRTDKR